MCSAIRSFDRAREAVGKYLAVADGMSAVKPLKNYGNSSGGCSVWVWCVAGGVAQQ
jgi:hypothetical protein